MFDEVVLLEDSLVAEGKSAGAEAGRAMGVKQGGDLGRDHGFRFGAEMGFYRGCCVAWVAMHEDRPEAFLVSDKALGSMRALVQLAESLPRENPKDLDMVHEAQRVRAKFRAITAMLGLPVRFDAQGQAKANDMSF